MQTRLASALSLVGREALRIVLSSGCVVCGRELPWSERVASCCASCWSALPRITGPKCHSCALPLPPTANRQPPTDLCQPPTDLCIDCLVDPLPVEWCEAWGEYRGGLDLVLQALKFRRHDFLDQDLAALLHETVETHGPSSFDSVAAVPMSRKRERKRGYNQAELLARALAGRLGVRCDMTLLKRRREGTTQSTLPKRDRAANVRGAFAASPAAKGRSILIVDDICTTGETLRACAAALQAAGAARVCAVVVAKAI